MENVCWLITMHVANRVLAYILQTLGMLENFGKVVATQQHESMVVNTTSNGVFVLPI